MEAVLLDRISVVQTDLAEADADVLVVPSNVAGTFSQAWLGMLSRMTRHDRVEAFELGGLRTVQLSAGLASLNRVTPRKMRTNEVVVGSATRIILGGVQRLRGSPLLGEMTVFG